MPDGFPATLRVKEDLLQGQLLGQSPYSACFGAPQAAVLLAAATALEVCDHEVLDHGHGHEHVDVNDVKEQHHAVTWQVLVGVDPRVERELDEGAAPKGFVGGSVCEGRGNDIPCHEG